MKLRLGFVTNSSSTNYTIIWKGNIDAIDDLFKANMEELRKSYNTIAGEYADDEFEDEEDLDSVISFEDAIKSLLWVIKNDATYLENFGVSMRSVYGQDEYIPEYFDREIIVQQMFSDMNFKDMQTVYFPE